MILGRAAVSAHQESVRELRRRFLDAVQTGDPDAVVHQTEYRSAQESLDKAERALRRQEDALGVHGNQELTALVNSEYIRERMNARALHRRFLERMRARKFEKDPVERLGRRLKNGKSFVLVRWQGVLSDGS